MEDKYKFWCISNFILIFISETIVMYSKYFLFYFLGEEEGTKLEKLLKIKASYL